MNLKDKIKSDIITAMKAGDGAKKTTLGMLQSAIKNRELDKRAKLSKSGTPADQLEASSQLTDEEVIESVSSEIKKRKDAIEQFIGGGRPELAEGEKAEIEMLKVYMPEQMSEDEVKKLIADAVASIRSNSSGTSTDAAGPKDMGKVMGAISAKIKGKFDGSRASAMVKEALSGGI